MASNSPLGFFFSNASKAALHAYGDTLRIELEPFGVEVITVFYSSSCFLSQWITFMVNSTLGRYRECKEQHRNS